MSVDTTLLIGSLVEESYAQSANGRNWLNVTATIDLKSLGRESLIHNFANRKDEYKTAYFYASDGNTQIFEDMYGTELYAVPVTEFVKVFRQECQRNKEENGSLYRRLAWALPLLTRMKNYESLDNLHVVLFYH